MVCWYCLLQPCCALVVQMWTCSSLHNFEQVGNNFTFYLRLFKLTPSQNSNSGLQWGLVGFQLATHSLKVIYRTICQCYKIHLVIFTGNIPPDHILFVYWSCSWFVVTRIGFQFLRITSCLLEDYKVQQKLQFWIRVCTCGTVNSKYLLDSDYELWYKLYE